VRYQRGQNTIEVLLALALFIVMITGLTSLMLKYYGAVERAAELYDVKNVAAETSEALEKVAANNWATVVDGNYGLSTAGSIWSLTGTPDLVKNKYTRTISISSVKRDSNCNVLFVGGMDDPDTKLATTTISWSARGLALSKSYYQYISNWRGAPESCIIGQARSLTIDVSAATIDATKKSMVGAKLINNSDVPITLDKMTLTWTKEGEIQFVKINGSNVWHSTNGTGTPQGEQPSGTELDIVDVTIPAHTTYNIDNVRFDEKIDGAQVTIAVMMIDGSTRTQVKTLPFNP
jgi:type II secretory pathway pseudopilin PulG